MDGTAAVTGAAARHELAGAGRRYGGLPGPPGRALSSFRKPGGQESRRPRPGERGPRRMD